MRKKISLFALSILCVSMVLRHEDASCTARSFHPIMKYRIDDAPEEVHFGKPECRTLLELADIVARRQPGDEQTGFEDVPSYIRFLCEKCSNTAETELVTACEIISNVRIYANGFAKDLWQALMESSHQGNVALMKQCGKLLSNYMRFRGAPVAGLTLNEDAVHLIMHHELIQKEDGSFKESRPMMGTCTFVDPSVFNDLVLPAEYSLAITCAHVVFTQEECNRIESTYEDQDSVTLTARVLESDTNGWAAVGNRYVKNFISAQTEDSGRWRTQDGVVKAVFTVERRGPGPSFIDVAVILMEGTGISGCQERIHPMTLLPEADVIGRTAHFGSGLPFPEYGDDQYTTQIESEYGLPAVLGDVRILLLDRSRYAIKDSIMQETGWLQKKAYYNFEVKSSNPYYVEIRADVIGPGSSGALVRTQLGDAIIFDHIFTTQLTSDILACLGQSVKSFLDSKK